MPLYNIVHNSDIKVNNYKKNHFEIFNEPLNSKKGLLFLLTSYIFSLQLMLGTKFMFELFVRAEGEGGVALPPDLKNIPELSHKMFL